VSIDEIKKRFVNEIKLRGYDDKYIDRNEEREILQIAIQMGVNIESARAALAQVCEAEGYVQESAVLKLVMEQIEAAAANDGKIDQREFELIFDNAKKAMQGKKTDRQIKTMIVTLMEDSGHNRIKTGWFSDWYKGLKKELGI
jgi:hypothetical protein